MLTLVFQEWQLLKANKVYWCCLVLLGFLTGGAFLFGCHRASQSFSQDKRFKSEQFELQLLVAEAVKDQANREGPREMRRAKMEGPAIDLEQLFQRELNDIEKGRFRVLWNFSTGRFAVYHLPWRTWKPPAILEEVTIGESLYWPKQYLLDRTRQGKTLTSPSVSNPFRSMIGTFDVSTLVLVVLPLFMILLLFDLVSRDREHGMMQLIESQGVPYPKLIAVRMFLRCLGIAVSVNSILCVCVIASRYASLDMTIVLFTALLVLGIGCYVIFWGTLAWMINALGMQSVTNALILLLFWIVYVAIVPLALFEMTARSYPVIPMSSLAAKEIEIRQKLREERDQKTAESQSQRQASNSTPIRKTEEEQIRNILRELRPQRELISLEIDNVVRGYQQRGKALTRLFPISPLMSMQNSFELVAGNSLSQYIDFVQQTKDFQNSFLTHFQELPHSRTSLGLEDIEHMPKYQPVPMRDSLSWRPFGFNILILVSWSTMQFILGCCAFRYRLLFQSQ
jgi:ABC-2 type transport system permease protein